MDLLPERIGWRPWTHKWHKFLFGSAKQKDEFWKFEFLCTCVGRTNLKKYSIHSNLRTFPNCFPVTWSDPNQEEKLDVLFFSNFDHGQRTNTAQFFSDPVTSGCKIQIFFIEPHWFSNSNNLRLVPNPMKTFAQARRNIYQIFIPMCWVHSLQICFVEHFRKAYV